MPNLNLFTAVKGRNAVTLFEIRLDNDFIVFRGNEDESAGQLLHGVVVLCLSAPLKLDEVRLQLSGTHRLSWTEAKGISDCTVEKTASILQHRWAPFVGGGGRSVILPPGNYEWPFELTLAGNTVETVEGIPEASISYRLDATVARGKLAHDLDACKHLRVVRTLSPTSLELLHAAFVDKTWPGKLDYSITLDHKAVVLGAAVPLHMRFTPLLKGLQLRSVSASLVEMRECCMLAPAPASTDLPLQAPVPVCHRVERQVTSWRLAVVGDNGGDPVDGSGQVGWMVHRQLCLPARLRQCIQDLDHHNIKVRHKVQLSVILKNPDGHLSELRAGVPISVFLSPNVRLDEQGDPVRPVGPAVHDIDLDMAAVTSPPAYGEHVLDILFEHAVANPPSQSSDLASCPSLDSVSDLGSHLPSPSSVMSPSAHTVSSNLASSSANPPTDQASGPNAAEETAAEETSADKNTTCTGCSTHFQNAPDPPDVAAQPSAPAFGLGALEHLNPSDLPDLNKVPSYGTAIGSTSPANRPFGHGSGATLPDYSSIVGEPGSHALPPASLSPPPTTAPEGVWRHHYHQTLAHLLRVPRPARLRVGGSATSVH